MRLILQRTTRASVEIDEERVAAIGRGLVILVGIEKGDGPAQARAAADKLLGLRVFEDDRGRMNLDLRAIGGAALVVSQFTLAASTDRGRRPSFDRAAAPEEASRLVDELAAALRDGGVVVESGRFGARMEVELVNSGPVTFVLEFPPDARKRGATSG